MTDEVEHATERFFPDISEKELWKFQIIRKQLDADPAYLDDPNCPYGNDIRRLFSAIRAPEAQQRGDDAGLTDLEAEVRRLYQELQEYGEKLEPDDTSGHNTYFNRSVSLLEKMVALQERAAGVKKVNEFTGRVLQIMEDVLTPDQRMAVMTRLRDIINGDS